LPPNLVADLSSIDPPSASETLYVEAVATTEADGPPIRLWELPVSAPSPYLSDQVDQSFLALQEELISQAGWDVLGRLDGMFESLENRPLPGLGSDSWNKAGRAFDLYYREALAFESRLEVVREELSSGTYWRVYVRTANQDGSQGEPLRDLPWDFQSRYGSEPRYYDEGGKLKESIPAGYYIDFTAVAADYGWSLVPSWENWRTYFPAIRFWHYENRQDLSWREAMLQLYTAEELAILP
jgi:TolB protein